MHWCKLISSGLREMCKKVLLLGIANSQWGVGFQSQTRHDFLLGCNYGSGHGHGDQVPRGECKYITKVIHAGKDRIDDHSGTTQQDAQTATL